MTERKEEEFIIGGARDTRKRAYLQREITGALEFEPLSGKMLYFALGRAVADNGTLGLTCSLPCTITPSTVVPGITVWREIRQPEERLRTWGNKIDRLELVIEQSAGIIMNVDLAGKDASTSSFAWTTPDIAYTLDPLSFYDSSVEYVGAGGTSTLTHLRSFRMEVRNNLEGRFSAGAGTYVVQEIREQGLEVTGRLVVDYPFGTFATDILSRSNEATMTVTVGNAVNGSMVITLNGITFESFPDAISGLDIMELDLSWTARKPTTGSAVSVVINHPSITTLGGLDF